MITVTQANAYAARLLMAVRSALLMIAMACLSSKSASSSTSRKSTSAIKRRRKSKKITKTKDNRKLPKAKARLSSFLSRTNATLALLDKMAPSRCWESRGNAKRIRNPSRPNCLPGHLASAQIALRCCSVLALSITSLKCWQHTSLAANAGHAMASKQRGELAGAARDGRIDQPGVSRRIRTLCEAVKERRSANR